MSKAYPYATKRQIEHGLVAGVFRIPMGGAKDPGTTISVSAAGAAIGFGSVVLGDLSKIVLSNTGSGLNIQPKILELAREVFIRGVKASLSFIKQDANIGATWSGTWSLGTTPTADLTLSGTDVNILDSSGAGVAIGPATAGKISAPALGSEVIKSTDTPLLWGATDEINLNMTVGAADISDGTTGVIKIYGYVELLLGQL